MNYPLRFKIPETLWRPGSLQFPMEVCANNKDAKLGKLDLNIFNTIFSYHAAAQNHPRPRSLHATPSLVKYLPRSQRPEAFGGPATD